MPSLSPFALLVALPILASAQTIKPQPISKEDCAAVFTHCDVSKNTNTLAEVVYSEAWNQGAEPGEEELLGYVFRRPLPAAGENAYLLVGINKEGLITRVHAQNTAVLDREFLAQLSGRELRSTWEIARTLEDVLHVPAKIKAMRGKSELSEIIVNEVKSVLALAAGNILKLDGRS